MVDHGAEGDDCVIVALASRKGRKTRDSSFCS